jgi:hypothetical protein
MYLKIKMIHVVVLAIDEIYEPLTESELSNIRKTRNLNKLTSNNIEVWDSIRVLSELDDVLPDLDDGFIKNLIVKRYGVAVNSTVVLKNAHEIINSRDPVVITDANGSVVLVGGKKGENTFNNRKTIRMKQSEVEGKYFSQPKAARTEALSAEQPVTYKKYPATAAVAAGSVTTVAMATITTFLLVSV